MELDREHIFESKYHPIRLVATEFDEPHPGRTLWRYKFLIHGVLQENSVLNYNFSGLHPDLTNFQIEDETGQFIFIPAEDSQIYEVSQDQYYPLPPLGETGNNQFVGNLFSNEKLVVIRKRSVQVVSLTDFQDEKVIFPKGKYHMISAKFEEGSLLVHFKDLRDYQEYTKRVDFENEDFVE